MIGPRIDQTRPLAIPVVITPRLGQVVFGWSITLLRNIGSILVCRPEVFPPRRSLEQNRKVKTFPIHLHIQPEVGRGQVCLIQGQAYIIFPIDHTVTIHVHPLHIAGIVPLDGRAVNLPRYL